MLSRIGGMHVQAASAAIDLRRPDLDELNQAVLQAALLDAGAPIEPRFHWRGRGGKRVQSRCHDHILRQGPFPKDMTRWIGWCDMGVGDFLAIDACQL
jgi:hypothetical protein